LKRAEIALNAQEATRNALGGWQDANQSIGHLLVYLNNEGLLNASPAEIGAVKSGLVAQ
jgi:hypothetical protein